MSLARLLRSLVRRAVRDPGEVARLVVTRLRDEPAHVLLRALGGLPAGARARVAAGLGLLGRVLGLPARRAGWPELLRLTALDVRGDRDRAVARAAARAGRLSAPGRLVVAGWLAEVDRAREGLALLDGLADVPRVQRVRGRVSWRAGDWTRARDELAAAQAAAPQASTARLLERVGQDLAAVDGSWWPSVPAHVTTAGSPRRPGRAVHLLNNSLPVVQAGYTVRAQRIARAQRANGIDPVMVTKLGFPWRQGFGGAPERDEVDGIPYVHVPDPGGDAIFGTTARVERAVERVGPVVAQLGPAVLHPTSPFDNAQLALALGARLEVPVVYELRGFLEETWLSRAGAPAAIAAAQASDRYRLTRAMEGRCAAAADHVVTLGEAMKADLVARGVDARTITVVPNAVDLDAFTPSAGNARGLAVRDGLDIPPGRTVLGYISSLVPYEGVEVLLAATRTLLDRGADVEVLIVGDGTARAGWEQLAATLGLGARARFTGRVPHEQIQGYYEAIDLFVVPRRDERVCRLVTPLKPVEAMALERCVVVSDVPALAEMVEPGVTGASFAAGDADALADTLEPLLDDPDTRARLGAAARQRVAEQRTWAANGVRYREVYDRLGVLR